MSVIYLLIPIAFLFVVIACVIFYWAVNNDQFEDLEREGYNILFDEDTQVNEKEKEKES